MHVAIVIAVAIGTVVYSLSYTVALLWTVLRALWLEVQHVYRTIRGEGDGDFPAY